MPGDYTSHVTFTFTFAGAGANLTVLALPGRCFVKVDAKATSSNILIAASAGHCNAAMAAVLGMMVSAGGLASTPLALLASHSQVSAWPCLASYPLVQVQTVLLCSACCQPLQASVLYNCIFGRLSSV